MEDPFRIKTRINLMEEYRRDFTAHVGLFTESVGARMTDLFDDLNLFQLFVRVKQMEVEVFADQSFPFVLSLLSSLEQLQRDNERSPWTL